MTPDAIRDKVSVIGVGCCQFGENWDKSREDMIVDAVYEAYADAGIEDPQRQIEAVFAGAVYPREGSGEVADALRLYGKPITMLMGRSYNLSASATSAVPLDGYCAPQKTASI
jgi:acetyl-CoA C-acetyltransferase